MKKQIFLLGFFAALAGCHSGHIAVEGAAPAQATDNQSTPTVKGKVSHKSPGAGAGGAAVSSIFFSSFSFFDDGKLSPTGLGFISDQSQTTTPYIFKYPGDGASLLRSTFVPWGNGVMFIKRLDSTHDAISFTQIPDLDTREVYSHTSRLLSLTRSEDRKWLGWVDEKGAAFLWHSTTKKITQVALPTFKAKYLQILPVAGRLLVAGVNTKNPLSGIPEVLIFNLGENAEMISEIPALAGQLSRGGKWLALTQKADDKTVLTLTNLQNPDLNFELAHGVKGQSFQTSWSGDESLAFVTPTSATEGDLSVASMGQKKSSVVTHLSSPYSLELVACPSWRGSSLYYGGVANGKMSIYGATHSTTKWTSRIVARPSSLQEGYACPNAERN